MRPAHVCDNVGVWACRRDGEVTGVFVGVFAGNCHVGSAELGVEEARSLIREVETCLGGDAPASFEHTDMATRLSVDPMPGGGVAVAMCGLGTQDRSIAVLLSAEEAHELGRVLMKAKGPDREVREIQAGE